MPNHRQLVLQHEQYLAPKNWIEAKQNSHRIDSKEPADKFWDKLAQTLEFKVLPS
jgi:hypothetical protein